MCGIVAVVTGGRWSQGWNQRYCNLTATVVPTLSETSVTVNNNSPIQDYVVVILVFNA